MINDCMFWSLVTTISIAIIILHMLWEDKKFMTQIRIRTIYILTVIACGTGLTFVATLIIKRFVK